MKSKPCYDPLCDKHNPKPINSTDQIAAEAWDKITYDHIDYDNGTADDQAIVAIIKSAIEKARLQWDEEEALGIGEQRRAHRAAQASEKWTSISSNYNDGDGRPYRTAKCGEVQLFSGPENTVIAAVNAHNQLRAKKLPHDWNKGLPVITHLTPPSRAARAGEQ